LLAGGYVNLSASSTLTTAGSNVLVASNTDNSGGGHIYASGNQSIVTSGGTVTFGGGDLTGSGYAEGTSSALPEGIRFYAALSINTSVKANGVSTGGGDIVLRGRSATSAAAAYGAFGVGVETTTTLDAGTATIRLDGISRVSSGDSYNMGVRLLGDVTATSASTSATAIYISGTGGSAGSSYSGGQGIRLTGGSNLLTTTGVGGGIKLSGTPGSSAYAVVFEGGSILSSSGPIELSGTAANSYVFLKNVPTLGFKAGTSVTSSTANILLSFFDADWGGSSNPIIATSGSFTFRPSGTSFNRQVASGWFNLPTTLSALTLGSATNTSNIYINTALTVQGPVTVQGGWVDIVQAISAAGDVLIDADTGTQLSSSFYYGVNMSAGISTTAASNGNVTITGRGGPYAGSYGVYMQSGAAVTAGGTGSISITGIGGANTGNSNFGVRLLSSLTTGAGSITVSGTGGGTGAAYDSDGLWVGGGATIRTTSGPVLLVGIPGVGSGSDPMAFVWGTDVVTLGNSGQSGNITLRANAFYFEPNVSVLGTGSFTVEPSGASFTSTLTTAKFVEASTLTGYTLGKSGNTGAITVDGAVTVAGPIAITGGAVTLSADIATTSGSIGLTTTTLTGTGGIAIPSGGTLTINQTGTSTYDGLISGAGGLTKSGAGALSLTANETFSGATAVSAGTLALGIGGANGWLSNTSGIAIDGTLQVFRGADVTLSAPLSGAGTLEIKGAYRATFSSNLTTTAQTIATGTTVAEVVRRLAGGMLNGTAIVGSGTVREAGAYQVNFDPVANVATFQFQHYDTAYTKTVFVKLIQNGADVQALVNTASPHINGTAYIVPNLLGQNMATYAGVTYDMGLATSTGATGYGVGRIDLTAKTTVSSLGTFSGTLKLSATTEVGTGTNVYTKNIPGTLELTGGLGSVSAIVNNGLIIVNDATGLTLNASISGAGDLFKKGSATTTFAQGVTFSGVTVVGAGGLTLQGAYGSASHTILSGATLTLDVASGDRDFAATTFLGTGKLAKTGAGRALWGSSIGAFSLGAGGLIDIQGGTFLASSSGNDVWTSNYADVNVASGATLAVAEGAMRVDALTGSGSVTIGGAGGTGSLAVGVDNHSAGAYNATAGTATFSGIIADSAVSTPGAFTKLGTGTQLLSGANTYSGATTVSAGTLAVTDAAGLGTTAAGTTVASGASLDLRNALVGAEALTINGGTLMASTGTSSLAGAITLGATSTLSVAGTQLTLDGIISGATFGLTKSGAGVAILTGANTFTGPLAVNGGTLRIGGAGRLAAGTYVDAITVASGATFDYASSANQTLGATGVAAASNTLRGAGSYLFGGTGTLTLRGDFSATGTVEVSQAVTMTGGTNGPNTGLGQTTGIDIKNGGTITLTGTPNSFTGTTTSSVVTIRTGGKLTTDGSSGQTFHLGAITLAGGEIATGAGATTTVWGIYNFDRTITVTEDSTISAQFSAMYQTGGTVYNVAAGKTLTVSGTLSSPSSTADNGLVLNSAAGSTGTMVLTGVNTYTGATTITRGTLRIGGAGLIGNGSYSPNITNSGTLEVATSANQTLTGAISGAGSVTQSGSGTTVLTGTQTYTGATTVSAGVLQVGNGGTTGALATSSALSIATGGTLRFYRSDVFPTSITVANAISGDGTLEFRSTGGNGAGQFAFTGTNTLSASAVILLNQARLVVDGQAYLSASLPLVRVLSGGQLYINRTGTIANPLELGAGLGWKETDGTQLGVLHVPAWGLAGPVTFSGNVTLAGNSSIAAWASQADITMSGVIADGGNGYGFTKLGTLKLTLTGANTFTGTTTISAGTLQVGGGGTAGIVGGPIVNNSALTFSRSDDLTFATAISGTGTLTKLGTNTLTLTGASTYSGATTVTAGGLVFRRDTAPSTSGFSGAGAVTIEPAGTSFGTALNASYTFATTLTGLTLGKAGSTAALTIPANVSIAGPISLYGGDLTLTGGLAATATGDILLRSSGTLTIAATRTVSTTAGDVTLTAARFVNNSSSTALAAGGAGKTWRVWSTNANPYHATTGDVTGSLAFDYRQYNATYGTSTVLGTGKGMLYSYAPTLTAAFSSTPTKVYDRTDTAAVTGAMVTASSGYVGGDTNAAFTVAGATYASRNVGNGQLISFSSAPTVVVQTSSATGSKPAYGYQITGLSSLTGNITPLALTLTGVSAANKVYDRTVTAAVSGGSITPLTGDTVTVDASAAAGTFANWNVGTAKAVTVTGYVLGGSDAGNYSIVQPTGITADITARPLSVTGVTAANKVYNRSLTATLSGGSVAPLTGDTVSLVTTGRAGVFADWNVGTAKAVTVSGYTLSGTDAGNYSVVQPSGVAADITALSLTVTGVTAANKVYDRTVTAALSGGAIAPISGDTVTLDVSSAAGSFANWNVGTAKEVTAAGYVLGGADAGNYAVAQPTGLTANITALSLAVTGVTAANKVYDRTVTATLSGGAVAPISGDTVTLDTSAATGVFANRNVGLAKAVTASGYVLGGSDAGNYAIAQPTGVTADITAKSLTISGLNPTKVYDRSLNASVSGGTVSPISGDTVTVDATGATGAFADWNVGTGKSVTYAGFALGGAAASNYVIVQPSGVTGDITALSLAVTGATAANKTYDQLLTATISGGSIAPISGDVVSLDISGRAGVFADKNVGTAKGVTVTGYTISGTDAGNYALVQPMGLMADITALTLAVTGATAANKTYDQLLAATISGGSIAPISGDAVTLDSSGRAGVFADKNVGTAKGVTVSGYTISGTDAGNYALVQPAGVTADITALSLAVTGATAANKTYDQLLTATISGGAIAPISGDTVTLDISGRAGVFADKNVGTAKGVTVSGYTISGADAGNYALVQPAGVTANITALSLAVTGATAANKTYDQLLTATISGGAIAPISGDTVALDISGRAGVFADKNVGAAKGVTVSGYVISGTDAGNYALVQPTGLTADITALSLAVTGATAANKTYDQLLTATISGGSIAPISGDTVTLDISGRAGVFADKNVGTAKGVTVSGYTISGTDAGNYALVQPTGLTADIAALSLAVTGATAANKTYDQLRTATISGGSIAPISGDAVTLDISGRAGIFADKNVGTAKGVTVSGYTISGTDAGNYALVQPAGVTANIAALSLAVTGATAANKTYDQLLTATISGGTIAPISGDTVTLDISGRAGVFADKNVGTAKGVSVSGYTISGTDAGNYALVQPTGLTADITALSLAVTGATAANKTYDQLLTATLSGGSIYPISGDAVTLDISGRAGVFGDKNVGTAKGVTVSGYTISGTDAGNYALVQPTGLTADITALTLAVTGATAANKTYDQLRTATISGGSIAPISGDAVTLDTSGRAGIFADKNVGTAKGVTVSGYTISGTDAGNYALVQPTGVTANITALSLAVTGATAANKTYDQLLTATLSGGSIAPISGDTVTLDISGRAGVFADKNVGTAKGVTVSGYTIAGTDAGNYALVQPTGLTADITALSLAVTGATAANKTYDQLLTATISGGSVAPISGDTVTLDISGRAGVFADKNVGTAKGVTVSGYTISGTDAGNYALVQPTGLTADITALSLAVTGATAANKTYDQLLIATISGGSISVISGDTVSLDISGRAGVFADKNVGTAKGVTVSGYTISGTDAGNYALVQPTGLTADITALSLAVTGATAANKTYDQLRAATISGGSIAPISGDTVALDTSGRAGVFADKNVGAAKGVTVSGYTISGTDAGNYALVQPTGLTADITALTLAVTGATAVNKTYDQLRTATISGGTIAPISGDTVSLDISGRAGVFADKNVGIAKGVTVSGYTISGTDAGNYALVQPTGLTADITALSLAVTGATAANKTYDQLLTATISGGAIAPISGDTVTLDISGRAGVFADKNVGAAKGVTVSGYTISGTDAGNYALVQPAGVTADITALSLAVTGATAANKTYDQLLTATISGGSVAPISGDTVSLDISGRAGVFADKNVGMAKGVMVSGYTISGTDAGNYALVQPTGLTADITALSLAVTGATAANKTYDQLLTATISGGTIAPISGDTVTLDISGRAGVFADKNVGTAKGVTVSGYTISGTDAGNYALVQPTGLTADITALTLAVTGATAANKTYDQLLTATISGGSISVFSGDTVTLDISGRSGVFADKNVGTSKGVTVSGYIISGTDAGNYALVQPTGLTADITALTLAVTGATAANKTYDQLLTATISGGSIAPISGDTVTLDISGRAGVFADKNVGTAKGVTVSGYTISGADAGNYALVQPTGLTADITALTLAVTGATAANKTYDQLLTATISGGAITPISGDTVTLDISGRAGVFADKNVGSAKGVTVSGYAISGTDAGNYALVQPTGLTADITALSLAVTGTTAANKTYDQLLTATISGGSIAPISGDVVTLDISGRAGVFADKNVGTAKGVTVTGYTISGTDAGNYALVQPTGLTADITALTLAVTGATAANKTYDQLLTATIAGGSIAPISGDDVTLDITSRAGVFADKNVGTSKGVTVSGYTISGADAGNYALIQPTSLTADITALSLAVTGATVANKTYDQLLTATISGGAIAPISGDAVTLDLSGRAGVFADKNVGTAKSVTVSGYSISGADAGNYDLVQPTGLTADITALALAVTGATAANKTYDQLLTATISGGSIAPISGDVVTLDISGRAGVFADKNVGTAKGVMVSGYTISGADAGNYALVQPAGLTADITALTLAVTGATAANKTYDQLLTAAIAGGSIAPISGDDVSLDITGRAGVFADKNVGTAKGVTVSGYTISGTDAGNYALVQPTGLTADITALSLAVTGATAANKTYDQLLTATISGGSIAPISGDTVTLDVSGRAGIFADKNAGTAKGVTVSGYTISGADAGNYALVQPTGVTADITALTLAVTGVTAGHKVYDRSVAATLTGGSVSPIPGDVVSLDVTGATGLFADWNVGAAKSVAASGYALLGTDAGNYALVQPTGLSADIAALTLAVTGVQVVSKTQDGNRIATLTGGIITPLTGDSVVLDRTAAVGLFADDTAGTAKLVAVSGYALSGLDAANYALLQPTGLVGDIKPISRVLYPNVQPMPLVSVPVSTAMTWAPTTLPGSGAVSTAAGVQLKVSVMPMSSASADTLSVGQVFAISAGNPVSLQSVSLEVVAGFVPGQTILEVTAPEGLTVTVDNQKGTITVSGEASSADYEGILRTVVLRSASGSAPSKVTLKVGLTDAEGSSVKQVVELRRGDVAASK
jgi:autotransporter-associated beta strand protein